MSNVPCSLTSRGLDLHARSSDTADTTLESFSVDVAILTGLHVVVGSDHSPPLSSVEMILPEGPSGGLSFVTNPVLPGPESTLELRSGRDGECGGRWGLAVKVTVVCHSGA